MAKPRLETPNRKDTQKLSQLVKKGFRKESDFLKLFSQVLTDSENLMIKNRIKIGKLLLLGSSVRNVAREVGVGTDTVVRVSRMVKNLQFQKILSLFEITKSPKTPKVKPKTPKVKKASHVWVFGRSEEEI